VPPAYNEIFPAWVLSENLYAVLRNEGKYKKRNKARRTQFVFDVFRRDIVEMMIAARDRLKSVRKLHDLYLDEDVAGLGKNVLTEESRLRGIEVYNFFIEYFALQGLAARVRELVDRGERARVVSIYRDISADADWEYRRSVINSEGYGERTVAENLRRLADIHDRIARDTERAKERDDIRGKKIIRDYAEANTQAAADGFVKETWERSRRVKAEMDALALKLLDS
jgi:hypothetical protein